MILMLVVWFLISGIEIPAVTTKVFPVTAELNEELKTMALEWSLSRNNTWSLESLEQIENKLNKNN